MGEVRWWWWCGIGEKKKGRGARGHAGAVHWMWGVDARGVGGCTLGALGDVQWELLGGVQWGMLEIVRGSAGMGT